MVRSPEIRYTGANTAAVLAQKPTGFNYDVCAGALLICGRDTPGPSTTYNWAGAPRSRSRRRRTPRTRRSSTTAPTARARRARHARQQHHQPGRDRPADAQRQRQQPSALDAGRLRPRDPDQRDADRNRPAGRRAIRSRPARSTTSATSTPSSRARTSAWRRASGTRWRSARSASSTPSLIDGRMINQFDNSVPKIASRNGDPATVARQFARGYLGLQTHGGNDRISYREIQVREFTPAEIPVNTVAPTVTGTGFTGSNLTCNTGTWTPASGVQFSRQLVPVQQGRSDASALPRPEPDRPRQLHHAGRSGGYVRQPGSDLAGLVPGRRGHQQHLLADRRGRRQGHPLRPGRQHQRRHGLEDRRGPGDPGGRDAERRRQRAGDDEPHARHARRRSATSSPAWRVTTTRRPRRP